jgi:hypothetical protein
MKKYFVLFCMIALLLGSANLNAQGLIYYQDHTATDSLRIVPVSGLTPLPINGVVSIGSATIEAGQPPTANLMNVVSVTTSPADVASLVNRKSINVFNTSPTETLWASFDSSTASAAVSASIPVPPMGFVGVELDSLKVLSLVGGAAITAIVYQDGY